MTNTDDGTEETHQHPGRFRDEGEPVGPDAVRRAVFDAAAELFGRHGVEAVSLRDIASAADVQMVLIARYVGNRAELIDSVFQDLSAQLAGELLDHPLEAPAFDRHTALGRWIIVLNHLVQNGVDASGLAGSFNPVSAVAMLSEQRYGLGPYDARVRGAQIVAHALGRRLFEPYLVAAGGLESTPIETLRDEYGATNRRIGATPLRADRDLTVHSDERRPSRVRRATYNSVLAHFEREVIHRVNADLHGQDAARVHDRLVRELHDRLPGDVMDERTLWEIAMAIAGDAFPDPCTVGPTD